jgi:hypothetical protein
MDAVMACSLGARLRTARGKRPQSPDQRNTSDNSIDRLATFSCRNGSDITQVMERCHLMAQTDIKTVQRQLDLDYVREVTLGRGRLILAQACESLIG